MVDHWHDADGLLFLLPVSVVSRQSWAAGVWARLLARPLASVRSPLSKEGIQKEQTPELSRLRIGRSTRRNHDYHSQPQASRSVEQRPGEGRRGQWLQCADCSRLAGQTESQRRTVGAHLSDIRSV